MAIGTAAALMMGGGALLGGIAGASDKTQSYTSGVNVGSATGMENMGQGMLRQGAQGFSDAVAAGPGTSDVTRATDSSRSLAEMFANYARTGGLPSEGDISSSNTLASSLFGAQRTALSQNFKDQETSFARAAALQGRSASDPILRAKLAQEQTRQSSMLDAQQGAWSTNFALQQPMQRLSFAQQGTGVLQGLASQALANRQALAAMGDGIVSQERNWRLQTAQRYGSQTQEGSLGGAISGALGGLGAGMSMASGLNGLMASGGGAAGRAAMPSVGFASMQGAAPMSSMPMGPSMPSGFLGNNSFGGGPFAQGYHQPWQPPTQFQGPYAPSYYGSR